MTEPHSQQAGSEGRRADDASQGRRVLVTGAAGFLGRHVVATLAEHGWQVVALLRQDPAPTVEPSRSVSWVRGDITDPSVLADALSGADAVCHLAAYIPSNHEDVEQAIKCLEVNAAATLRLADLALSRSVRRFIYVSGSNAYQVGSKAQDAPAPLRAEAHPLYPVGHGSYYLTSKVAGEIFVEHMRRMRGLPAISLRVSTPYGPGMSPRSVVARFLNNARSGLGLEVWDGGTATSDFVYVADVAWAIHQALEGGETGVYNLGSGQATSALELARAVAATFPDRDVPITVKPPREASATGVPVGFPAVDNAKATQAWDYHPRSLLDGLRECRRHLEGG